MAPGGDKLRSLVGLALRSRAVALGRQACRRAADSGQLYVLVIAADAGASALRDCGGQAAGVPQLETGLDKRALGALTGRDELAVLGITDPQIAAGLLQSREPRSP